MMGDSGHYGLDDERFAKLLELAEEANENPKYSMFRWEATPHGLVAQASADFDHGGIVDGLRTRILTLVPDGIVVREGLEFLVGGGFRRTPDLYVIDPSLRSEFRDGRMASTSGVWLFGEVTSRATRHEDLGKHPETWGPGKPVEYADAGVPIYLIVDRTDAMVHVYSDPEPGRYAAVTIVNVGAVVKLPEPIGGHLETEWIKELLD